MADSVHQLHQRTDPVYGPGPYMGWPPVNKGSYIYTRIVASTVDEGNYREGGRREGQIEFYLICSSIRSSVQFIINHNKNKECNLRVMAVKHEIS